MAYFEDVHFGTARVDKLTINSNVVWSSATITVGTEADNVVNVAVQLKDGHGNNIANQTLLKTWISDSATAGTVATTAPDGGCAIGTNGTIIRTITAGKDFEVLSSATGAFDLDVTESGTDTFYLYVANPATGAISVSDALSFTA